MSDSDSDVGPSRQRGAAQLANMASQFLGTAATSQHPAAAESIFIGQQSHSGISESSDYGLGALDPFALDEPDPAAAAPAQATAPRSSAAPRSSHEGWAGPSGAPSARGGPAVIQTHPEDDYGYGNYDDDYPFQSEVIDQQRPLREKRGQASSPPNQRAGTSQPSQHEPQSQAHQPQPAVPPQDTSWLAVYLVSLLITLGIWLWSYLFAHAPYSFTSQPSSSDTEVQEAQSIFSILPTLTSFTLVSIASSMGVMFLLSQAVRRMVWGLLIAGPVMLVSTAFWGWGMSFASLQQNQGSETRWACFVSLVLASVSGRMIYKRIQRIDKTIQVIELATTALLAHPALFGLQAALLLAHLVLAIPFFSLFCRLLLLHPTNPQSPVLWMSLHVFFTYLWTLAIVRNASKLTASVALSHWYFSRHEPEPEYATSIELVQAAFARARGPQAGTVVVSSLLLTTTEMTAFVLVRVRKALRQARGTQGLLASFECVAPAVIYLCGVVEHISSYSVIWCGITGSGFWPASRRASGLIRSNGMGRTADYLLVKLVLSLLSMSFSVLAGLVGLLSSNHPKSIHLHHLFASLLCFFIPWYTVKLCSDLLANAIDTMFVCFNVDLERGSCHSNKAKEAFLGSAEERA